MENVLLCLFIEGLTIWIRSLFNEGYTDFENINFLQLNLYKYVHKVVLEYMW